MCQVSTEKEKSTSPFRYEQQSCQRGHVMPLLKTNVWVAYLAMFRDLNLVASFPWSVIALTHIRFLGLLMIYVSIWPTQRRWMRCGLTLINTWQRFLLVWCLISKVWILGIWCGSVGSPYTHLTHLFHLPHHQQQQWWIDCIGVEQFSPYIIQSFFQLNVHIYKRYREIEHSLY